MKFEKSSTEIQNELLNEIDNSYEKSKGYFLWDILKAISIGIKHLLSVIQSVSNRLDVDNLEGEQLEKFIYQRTGIKRKEATFSEGILLVNGNGIIKKGDFFETSGLIRFEAIEEKNIIGSDYIKIRAAKSGSISNVPTKSITKIPVTIQGITSCTNNEPTLGGYEAESDSDLLKRYYEKLQIPATSGNIYHYIQWAKEVSGVGDAKVIPLWNGNNTVKVIIVNSERKPADNFLVKKVQDYIDPKMTGIGKGAAPIGAFCTIVSAISKEINISANIKIKESSSIDDIRINITNNIENYLKNIAFKQNYISYAIIGSKILECAEVEDYENLLINNSTSNITYEIDEVITLKDIDLLQIQRL